MLNIKNSIFNSLILVGVLLIIIAIISGLILATTAVNAWNTPGLFALSLTVVVYFLIFTSIAKVCIHSQWHGWKYVNKVTYAHNVEWVGMILLRNMRLAFNPFESFAALDLAFSLIHCFIIHDNKYNLHFLSFSTQSQIVITSEDAAFSWLETHFIRIRFLYAEILEKIKSKMFSLF